MRTDRNQTFDKDGNLVAEQVVEVDDTAEVNKVTIEDRAVAALADNRTFLAIASPTNAQVVAQVKALTRQNSAVIRLILNRLEGTD